MQGLFPEGYVFTWALFGLASAQVAMQLPATDPWRGEAERFAREAVEHVDSDRARQTFVAGMQPPWGAFYRSWSLYLKSVVLRALGPSGFTHEWIQNFERECDEFAQALEQYPSPFLCSYPGAAWPADTAVGVAGLAIHDQVLPPRYEGAIARWISRARERSAPELMALSHATDPVTGAPQEGVRGSSLALMSRVLADVDPAWAREQYAVLRREFVGEAFGLPGVREYPRGINGAGDIDSGPVLLGFSGPALVVSIGAAMAHGDWKTARQLLGLVEVVGVPIQWRGRRFYAAGVMPIGDAFLVWARTTPTSAGGETWDPALTGRWVFVLHGVSAIILILGLRLAAPQARIAGPTDG
jgi:hypothetical protein